MKIEYGYDRHVKSWNIILYDAEGNEIISEYYGDMVGVKLTIEEWKKEYNINKIEKIKAY